MFWFQGFRKIGQSNQRHSYSLSLDTALAELFRLYDQAGGPTDAAGKAIDAWIERTAAEPKAGSLGYGKLAQLLRTRDLHEFVVRDPALADVKIEILEQLSFHRSPESRWVAVRPKLIAALPQLCGCPVDSARGNRETYKRALSDPNSPAGQLLVTAALFHFDADPELPPENWSLRFRRGRFPHYDWEPIAGPSTATPFDWRPANPLCCWEYLAADLTHEVLRLAEMEAGQPRLTPLRDAGHLDGRKDAAAFTLYCRLERPPGGDAGAAQMSLLPVDPASFVPEVQRSVHRHLGAEGVRQFALVMGRLARQQPGQIAWLDVGELSALAHDGDATARQCRERGRKLLQVLALLCDIELQRAEPVAEQQGEQRGQQAAVRVSRFLTVLGREGLCAGSQVGADLNLDDPTGLTLHVAVDPIFWNGDGTALGDAYRDLSPAVLACSTREHPLLLGLAAWLPTAWERAWTQTGGVLQRSAERLFDEAGLWLREADRYRTAEQLKRDLARLQELGVLGQWRLVRGAARNVLDHEYRLVAPQRARQRATSLFSIPAEDAAAETPRQVRGWA